MKVLVVGGTRFVGVHLVRELLAGDHRVTIATRGQTPDPFGGVVERLTVERTDPKSLSGALSGRSFDLVYDSIAYSSNDVKYLLDTVDCGRYVMTSTASVYPALRMSLDEEDFDPWRHPLTWCGREDGTYDVVKRQAECALFQAYPHLPSAAVRFPYIIGEDDYTRRLYFYAEQVAKGLPMRVDNLGEALAFVHSAEAGRFLAWLGGQSFRGPINAASRGSVTLRTVIRHLEQALGRAAVYDPQGEAAPYNGAESFSLNLDKSRSQGFQFSELDSWIYDLLDRMIGQITDNR